MGRSILSWVCVFALVALPIVGCGDGSGGAGGSGGSGDTGGEGGSGGTGGVAVSCEGTVCPCTGAGVRAAVAEGGGPFTFDCDGPTTVSTGGQLDIDKDLELDGGRNLTIGNSFQWHIGGDVTASFTRMAFQRTIPFNFGDLTLNDVQVSGVDFACEKGPCAGVVSFGTLAIIRTTISDNGRAGVYTQGTQATTLISESLVARNSTAVVCPVGSQVTVVNSTVSGGIFGCEGGTVLSSTLAGTSEVPAVSRSSSLDVRDTVITGPCDATLTSSGYNIESPGDTCGFDQPTDQVDVTAEQLNLGPLQDNGGPTMTHALGAGSVAIDMIPVDACLNADDEPLTTDQRGVDRPQGTMCDVGAFEVQEGNSR